MTTTTGPIGFAVVDKPAGWTSHDVVGKMRKLTGTKKVGHAGTLDPMATGVLVVGVGRATRMLGRLALADKAYRATVRLGVTTSTDDAEGGVEATRSAAEVTDAAVRVAVRDLTGTISQVPSSVSAVKVAGRRAYDRVRAGEEVQLEPRQVTVGRFDIDAVRRADATVDVDVTVECTTGTYVRALARDLGAALGVGGHLTSLRRTRVGPFLLDLATTVDQLTNRLELMPLGDAAGLAFPRRRVDAAQARALVHGRQLTASGEQGAVAVFAPDGTFLALVEDDQAGKAKPLAVFLPAGS